MQHVEFHWYSAEVLHCHSKLFDILTTLPIQEGGLLGSQAVAKAYEERSANVLAMSQVPATLPPVLILVLIDTT